MLLFSQISANKDDLDHIIPPEHSNLDKIATIKQRLQESRQQFHPHTVNRVPLTNIPITVLEMSTKAENQNDSQHMGQKTIPKSQDSRRKNNNVPGSQNSSFGNLQELVSTNYC